LFKGALIDLDGVIADTSTLHFKAWCELTNSYFAATLPPSLEEKTKGVSRSDSLKAILDHLNVTISDSMFQQLLLEKNENYKHSLKDLSPKNILPGIITFIRDLKQQNIKLALASASLNGPAILEKLELREAFDGIADPSKVAHGKPEPDIFVSAANTIGLSPTECIGIEDSSAGVIAIRKSGAFSVAVGKSPELQTADLVLPATTELKIDTLLKAYQHL